jgi:hypothetical protein
MITLTVKDATDSAFLASGGKAAVADVKTTGFTIVLDELSLRDLEYNWFAFSVDNPRKVTGKPIDALLGLPTTTTTPIPTPIPTIDPSESLAPTPTRTPTPTGSPQLPLTSDLQPNPTPTPEASFLKIKDNELGFARIRNSPTADAEEIGQIPIGIEIPYTDEQFGWLKITYEGVTGWVSSVVVDKNVVH